MQSARTGTATTLCKRPLDARDVAAEIIRRRECLDHIVVFSEPHLRQILRSYARYYNDIRTHRSLDKDAPVSRPVQRIGIINSHAILGGLHHHYVRI